MHPAQAAMLPDGRRLHLHHGPIDLVIEVFGPGRVAAYTRLIARFETLLGDLVVHLPELRGQRPWPDVLDPVARRMITAVSRFDQFITPMAAVAGSVADEMLCAIQADPQIDKAYVNNGGDVAFHLGEGHTMVAAAPGFGMITIGADTPVRGMATSGWGGRSHSLGIADSVTVLARCAAAADAAATLIANAVDLPGRSGIERRPAQELAPDSDLGARLVTVGVPVLATPEKHAALARGQAVARDFARRDLIIAAGLVLQEETCVIDPSRMLIENKDPIHA